MKLIILCLILGLLHNAEMAYLDVNTFFGVNGNLTQISWSHAVNTRMLLNQALSSNIKMIEADVVIGTVNGTNFTNIPIMAHPPANTSDLSLKDFLETIHAHNIQNITNGNKKGVKLDFKSIEALETAVPIMDSLYNNMTYPLWINSDILAGPKEATAIPVDPIRFFKATKSFKNSTLSVGWTTNYGPSITTAYTKEHVTTMLSTIKNNNVTQRITYPVRAGIAASSVDQLSDLVSQGDSTLTIWSSEGDPVNVQNLRSLIKKVGVKKTFIDVPASLEKDLNLGGLGAAGSLTPSFMGLVSILGLFLVL
ncbi:protein FAM151A isoform X1 [Onthophagus taurus]|uniref:protein FAM151A isoform X1 n=2 Tax=Onthophagus taurus TaxID=166361 RepID=UPI000C20D3F3|nr:protein FAM151A isoform X2 [Onthophagus taurus]